MPSGVYKRTPEHRAAISKGLRNSEAVKAAAEKQRGVPLSQEHCAAISKGLTGIPRTPEACAAISKAHAGVSLSPEHCATMSDVRKGVPLSPEHSAAIARSRTPEFNSAMSDTIKNSEAAKANANRMRGGDDIVEHHYIYDHSDLSKYTMKMPRSEHSKLHSLMRTSGIKVPHINVLEVD